MLYALAIGITVILVINALFAVWLIAADFNGKERLTERGDAFINVMFGIIGAALFCALGVIVSLIVGGS